MTLSNLPPGCSHSDLPGWHDIERDFTFYCESCEHEWTEVDCTVDSRGGSEVESKCPLCEALYTIEDDPEYEYDPRDYYDSRDEYDQRYEAQDHPNW